MGLYFSKGLRAIWFISKVGFYLWNWKKMYFSILFVLDVHEHLLMLIEMWLWSGVQIIVICESSLVNMVLHSLKATSFIHSLNAKLGTKDFILDNIILDMFLIIYTAAWNSQTYSTFLCDAVSFNFGSSVYLLFYGP